MAKDDGPPPVNRFDADRIFDDPPREEDYGAASGLPEYPEVGRAPENRPAPRATIPADRSGLAQAEPPPERKPLFGVTNWVPLLAVGAGLLLLWLSRDR